MSNPVINFSKVIKNLQNVEKQTYELFVGWTEPEMAKIAKIQEYGAVINVTTKMRGFLAAVYGIYLKKSTTQIIIPPRAHMHSVIKDNKQKWKQDLVKILIKTDYDMEKTLNILGASIRHDYLQVLMSGNFEKLADATLLIRSMNPDIKGGNIPLFATGQLQDKLTYEVS